MKDYPIAYCRTYLLKAEADPLLTRLGEFMQFEMCVGYNGRVWINSERSIDTIFIFGALDRVVPLLMDDLEQSLNQGYNNPKVKQAVEDTVASLAKS